MILLYTLEVCYKYLQLTVMLYLSGLQCKQNPIIGNSLLDKGRVFEQGKNVTVEPTIFKIN